MARACRIRPTTTPVNGNGATRAVSSTPAATSSRWNIGQAHGAFPPPDNGRPIEWFADTAYTTLHSLRPDGNPGTRLHVDGSGGLRDPATLARPDTGQLPGCRSWPQLPERASTAGICTTPRRTVLSPGMTGATCAIYRRMLSRANRGGKRADFSHGA